MSFNTPPDAPTLAQTYRHAMSNLAAGVHVITTDGVAGRYGITMTAVSSVTDDPPTVVLCINRQAAIQPILRANGALCINMLSAQQRDVAEHFAGITKLTSEERFRQHVWLPAGPAKQPQVADALVHLHGRTHEYHDMGSHTVFYVLIDYIDVADSNQAALLYFRRQFGHSAC